MMPYKKFTRSLAASMALVLTAAGLSGCGGKETDQMVTSSGEESAVTKEAEKAAMGRYLEEDVPVPSGCAAVEKLSFLIDGSLAMIYRDADYQLLYTTSKDTGASWEEAVPVAELLGLPPEDSNALLCLALGTDGSLMGGRYQSSGDSTGDSTMTYFYRSPDGASKELPIGEIMGKGFSNTAQFGNNGNLFLAPLGNGIKEINPTDGSLVHSYEENITAQFFGVCGKNLVVVADGTVHYYDTETGKPLEGMDALTGQITSNPDNLENVNSSSKSILFLEGDQPDSLFYADRGGMYRYALGGNVVEEIIDGSLNSIGSPDTGFTSLTRDSEGNLYLGVTSFASENGEGKIYRYTYSKDTPAVPDTELTVYSLKDNSFIRQAAAVFQKKYPDVYLNIESGMTGDDAVTSTDALKTLNTEIMAGKGPDVLLLDGIPAEPYIEKGLLCDLSGILSEAGLLENIKNAYTQEDGAVYAMPAKFGIPLLFGAGEDVDTITDLASMADALEKHKAEYGPTDTFYSMPLSASFGPKMLLQSLADSCSAAWLKKDGTLDEAMIKDFLKQAGRIYSSGTEALTAIGEKYGQDLSSLEEEEYDRTLGIGSNCLQVLRGMFRLSSGGLYTPMGLAQLDFVKREDSRMASRVWDGQAQNCFIPVNLFGISAKSTQKEAAENFIRFLFSEDGQMLTRNGGFPTLQKVYEKEDYWSLGEEGTCVMTVSDYNNVTGADASFDITAPSVDAIKEMQALGETLTTPAADNQIILNAVVSAGVPYLKGDTDLDAAAADVIREVNLYLSE